MNKKLRKGFNKFREKLDNVMNKHLTYKFKNSTIKIYYVWFIMQLIYFYLCLYTLIVAFANWEENTYRTRFNNYYFTAFQCAENKIVCLDNDIFSKVNYPCQKELIECYYEWKKENYIPTWKIKVSNFFKDYSYFIVVIIFIYVVNRNFRMMTNPLNSLLESDKKLINTK